MSTLLADELDRAERLERINVLRAEGGGRVLDVLRAGRGDKRAAERLSQWESIARALADQKTTDNPGLLPPSILGSPSIAVSAPVLAALGQPMPPGKSPTIAKWPSATATRNPAEKVAGTAAVIDGSDVGSLTMRVSSLACDVSFQLLDFGVGADFDAWLEAVVSADLEAQLLADLVAAGTTAADLAAALSACSPAATHVIGPMADVIAAAPTLAALRQARVANAPTVIVTPNTTATIVLSAPAVVIAAHPAQIGAELDVVLLGRSVGAWASGVAGTSVASAVQVVA